MVKSFLNPPIIAPNAMKATLSTGWIQETRLGTVKNATSQFLDVISVTTMALVVNVKLDFPFLMIVILAL